ncbi:MAG: protein kinase domain-containing protein [Desulfomonilaceae bacterium]
MSASCPQCGAPIENENTSCPSCRKILVNDGEEVRKSPQFEQAILPGTIVAGDYKIVRIVGRGGVGSVYEARQISLRNMPVALKMLHRDLNDNPNVITLMKKEVIISRELTHDNIIKIYNLEITEGRHFVVMEYVPGKSFHTLLKRDYEWGIDLIGTVFLQVCDALQYAHSRGVIHLDIKPANIIIRPSGTVKVCDFGIARATIADTSSGTQRLVFGSIGFMPPEQYEGRDTVSERSDIYALGATVYYALTGRVPEGELYRKGVPPCVFQALRHNPEDRFESIKAFRIAFVRETGLSPTRTEAARSALSSYVGGRVPGAEDSTQPLGNSGAVRADLASAAASEHELSENAAKKISHPTAVTPTKAEPVISTGVSETGPPKKRSGKRLIVAGICFVLIAAAIALLFSYQRARQTGAPGYEVAVLDENWLDRSRNRDVPVKIYYPTAGDGSFPAILFSPGLRGNRESGSHLGRYWAANGYVSVHIQHRRTGEDRTDPVSKPARPLLQEWRKFWNRTRDVSFAIDRLQTLNNDDPRFKGRIDLDRIGIAGVGLGAVTALALGGQVFHMVEGEEKTLMDTRIKAAVLLDPNVPHRQKAFERSLFSKITMPILHIVRAQDIRADRVGECRAPYDQINGPDQYLIILGDSDESELFDKPSSMVTGRDRSSQEIVKVSTAKFWDAYLKENSASKAWLSDGGLESAVGRKGKLEKKKTR